MLSSLRGTVMLAALLAVCLGAAPSHVQTSDYWAGCCGTKAVPADVAARWLTWAETDVPGSWALHPLGVKLILYSDPNRQIENHDNMWTNDETTFAHDCSGNRLEATRPHQFLMNPSSQHLVGLWKHAVGRGLTIATFDAVLNDDANDVAYVNGTPCNFNADEWLKATIEAQRAFGYPVIYNGLYLFRPGVSPSIALNQTAIGGMMEKCYALSPKQPKVTDWRWTGAEDTEIRMAREGKYFFCYNNDTSPADESIDARLYVYASFLLTYDPRTSVLWEYYRTPTRGHVMPEVQFVPFDPVNPAVRSIDDLHNANGVYAREYRNCYFATNLVGKCIVVVNPDHSEHHVDLRGYSKVLSLSGSGIFDGGKAQITPQSMPDSLPPLSALIAVR